ncbi:serine/threonine-protein kinase [Rhodobacter sp. NSM]|uniref:serine/threonine-protein kinase n=1 Tax=Rhodobacter sp. NSM TaxID=3457501 RepID=UPI003FD3521F
MIEERAGDIFRRGEILNHTYEIEGVLGRGGTGEVYRARNLISGRIVAIKALNRTFSGNDDYIGLMRREEQLRDVVDDAVVRYTECSRSEGGHVFLVMDHIDGPSLAEATSGMRMDPRDLLIVAHRVAEGLRAAHGRGIVHRDLSPDNIVLRGGAPERATLIDFGIAKDLTAGAQTIVGNDFAGKYEYAAPEQVDGRAEPRSDLYALGATLLAAWRGEPPFRGSTPGEIVRRKQQPLSTDGVPEPLRGLIDRLTAPRVEERPPSAAAVAEEIDRLLLPKREPQARPRKLWMVGGAALIALAVVVLGLRIWMQPPLASPYRLTATLNDLTGHAPDAAAAEAIAAAYAGAAGHAPEAPLQVARGSPDGWPEAVAEALSIAAPLEDWRLELSDRRAELSGRATDPMVRAVAETGFRDWAARRGFTPSLRLEAGPQPLTPRQVAEALDELSDCGPLEQGFSGESYGPLDAVTVTGQVAAAETAGAVRARLAELAGDRPVRVETVVLNPAICAVRRALPDVPPQGLAIWLGDAETGAPNLAGIFAPGEYPLVEVRLPATMTGLSLWVGIVDVTGSVLNVLPNVYSEEARIDRLGIVARGVRTVRVMPLEFEVSGQKQLFALQVDDRDFGKSEIVAVLSRGDIFALRRPKDESVASFTEALTEIRREEPERFVAVAHRLLESRASR